MTDNTSGFIFIICVMCAVNFILNIANDITICKIVSVYGYPTRE
jgi:hypothetical protein